MDAKRYTLHAAGHIVALGLASQSNEVPFALRVHPIPLCGVASPPAITSELPSHPSREERDATPAVGPGLLLHFSPGQREWRGAPERLMRWDAPFDRRRVASLCVGNTGALDKSPDYDSISMESFGLLVARSE